MLDFYEREITPASLNLMLKTTTRREADDWQLFQDEDGYY